MAMENVEWYCTIRCPVLIFIVLLWLEGNSIFVSAGKRCRPGLQIYKEGKCVDCPRCLPGQFNIMENVQVNECSECDKCAEGKFSNYRETSDSFNGLFCETHKNCAKIGRHVKTVGTKDTNTVCDTCLSEYFSGDGDLFDFKTTICYPCSEHFEDKQECTNFRAPTAPTSTPGPGTPARLKPRPEADQEPDPDSGQTPRRDSKITTVDKNMPIWLIILVVIVVLVVLVAAILVLLLRMQQLPLCRPSDQTKTADPESGTGLLEVDGPSSGYSSQSSESSGATTKTHIPDTSTEIPDDSNGLTLSLEEERTAESKRLKKDDEYIKAIGNANCHFEDPCACHDRYRSLLLSLKLSEANLDDVKRVHPVEFLHAFVQYKGKEATLLKLYKAFQKHKFQCELEVLVEKLRKDISDDKCDGHNENELSSTDLVCQENVTNQTTLLDGSIDCTDLEH